MDIKSPIQTKHTITKYSSWITATPSATTLSFPFYIMEAGHFFANREYAVTREQHNSFLLLYTVKGCGIVKSNNSSLELSEGCCVIIDCHTPHEYYSTTDLWDFLWIHFDGNGVEPLIKILYPSNIQIIRLPNPSDFEISVNKLLLLSKQNDMISCFETSAKLHTLFHNLLESKLKEEQQNQKDTLDTNITTAIDFIQKNYSQSITIEDILRDIPISKYHFIRSFRRVMGITPYSYLTNYRINISKILLRTSNKSIAEISEECGFLDTSNFIVQFKKHTGVKPTHYRNDFSKG